MTLLVRFERAGGRPPADDELLEVGDDGAFTARRTVAGSRVGTFAGRLGGDEVAALGAAVAVARAAGELWVATPRDGATETTSLNEDGAVTAAMGSNERATGAWAPLIERLRTLLDEATASPAAAVELEADAGGARLTAVGPGAASTAIDPGSVRVRLVRLDAEGSVLGQAQASGASAVPPRDGQAPGWRLDLPFDVALAPGPGEWLQVWVFATFRGDDGLERAVRLFRSVPG